MSLANGPKRAPGVAVWLFTLAAIYVALHRSGVYGLVADAQNLIAIFGVLRAIAFGIQARRANPDAISPRKASNGSRGIRHRPLGGN
jgi:hypothetical protein